MSEGFPMDIREVLAQLPHRYPFLLVDRVIECVPGKRIEAIKNVTVNEPFFPGHFPGNPVMPGVIILEALAQAAGIDDARFRRPVVPGDRLVLRATLERAIRGIWKFATLAEVDGEVAASATMMVAPEVKP
jgi:3-hydroxyacyl-[acyl-carrier-protein] dehydratase